MPDPVSDPTNTLSGEFRWDTMLVRLLMDDLAPVEPEKETAKIDLHMATAAAVHARTEAACQ